MTKLHFAVQVQVLDVVIKFIIRIVFSARVTVNRRKVPYGGMMNEEKERHQNLHLQNLFISESCERYSACNVIVLFPIVNGYLCFHELFGFFSLTPSIVSASCFDVSLTSKIYLFRLLRDSRCAKCRNSRHILTYNLLRLSHILSCKKKVCF